MVDMVRVMKVGFRGIQLRQQEDVGESRDGASAWIIEVVKLRFMDI